MCKITWHPIGQFVFCDESHDQCVLSDPFMGELELYGLKVVLPAVCN